jgi:hypothetical protein
MRKHLLHLNGKYTIFAMILHHFIQNTNPLLFLIPTEVQQLPLKETRSIMDKILAGFIKL